MSEWREGNEANEEDDALGDSEKGKPVSEVGQLEAKVGRLEQENSELRGRIEKLEVVMKGKEPCNRRWEESSLLESDFAPVLYCVDRTAQYLSGVPGGFHFLGVYVRHMVGLDNGGLAAWYFRDGEKRGFPVKAESIYSGQPFEALDRWCFFQKPEDCQRCCDWLNAGNKPKWSKTAR
jgi:hypothetical protein